ncbi:MAG TPA: hydrogenase 4 subunit B [Xanthobacteraceae bacterium]|nr:hydrogenase 4 subunit B [Xanthobacteraceae bacterium]
MSAIVGLWCVAGLLGIAATAIVASRWSLGSPLVYGASLVACLAGLASALCHLLGGAPADTLALPIGLSGSGSSFRVDALSAFFLVVVNLGGVVASLYALGYGRHETARLRVLPFFPAYLAGMNLVVLADDAFSFLIAWEFMSLTSWALVVAGHRSSESTRAGYVYLLMASFGTLVLVFAFGVLTGTGGDYSFAAIRASHPDSVVAALVLLLALVGAGSKAGLVPLHVWLPLAHPAAPSHVSALMSGVMTKVAIYGFVRIAFDLVGAPLEWWTSLVVLAFAGATVVVGILLAVMQRDLKRLLAYSTVENIGIIFIGLGLALAFHADGMGVPAALALTAALFHVLNHSLFKSLLFLGAGAVLSATGERNMDRLGGLIHRMPRTAFAFLIGCAAISALPPLNGFVSEWLTFQAILIGPDLPQWGLRFVIPMVGALLALAAALAAACFVKAYGLVFLGRPRRPAAEAACEVDRFSLAAVFILTGLCVIAGVLPGLVIDALAPVVHGLVDARMPAQTFLSWASIVPIAQSRSSYDGLIILLFLVSAGTLTAMFIHRVASRATRRSALWDCGYPDPSPLTQYSSSGFAMPIRRVFATTLFLVRETVDMPRPGETRAARHRLKVMDPAWRFLYGPPARGVWRLAGRLNRFQFLTIRRYLTLVFATLVLLLLVVAAWR